MIVVIIAGGSGTRLWPLSTHAYPKHLLKLTNERSLLQNTLDRVRNITKLEKIYVIPEESHVEHVYNQLTELPKENFLVEPGRRGTASCFLLALAHIKPHYKSDEPILFLWADHLIRDAGGFAATALKAGEISAAEGRLVFIGVEPTYPATGFGYMERDGALEGWQDAYNLTRFREKPSKPTAQKYFAKGNYLWNTGYLTGTLETFEREMQTHGGRLWDDYQALLHAKDLKKTYLKLPSEAIDTALSEKITDGIVVPGSFDWADVGSFRDLHGISLQDDQGNHVNGNRIELEDATNCYVRNDSECPVAVIGLDNVVVVNSPNGVLVVNKNFAQNVGDVAKRLQV